MDDDVFVYIDADWLVNNDVLTGRRPVRATSRLVRSGTASLKLGMSSSVLYLAVAIFLEYITS